MQSAAQKLDQLIPKHPANSRGADQRSVKRSLTDDAAVIISGGIDSTLVSAVIKEMDDKKYGTQEKKRLYNSIATPPKTEIEWPRNWVGNGDGASCCRGRRKTFG